MKTLLSLSLLSLSLISTISLPARADEPVHPDTASPSPDRVAAASKARFSVGRFVVESLAGMVVGSAAAYGTMKAVCGSEVCADGLLPGLVANVVATPLAVSVVGWGMGSQGTVGYAFYGEILGVGAGASVTTVSPMAALGFGLTLGPLASAGMFEGRSHRESHLLTVGSLGLSPFASPTLGSKAEGGSVLGGSMGLRGSF